MPKRNADSDRYFTRPPTDGRPGMEWMRPKRTRESVDCGVLGGRDRERVNIRLIDIHLLPWWCLMPVVEAAGTLQVHCLPLKPPYLRHSYTIQAIHPFILFPTLTPDAAANVLLLMVILLLLLLRSYSNKLL